MKIHFVKNHLYFFIFDDFDTLNMFSKPRYKMESYYEKHHLFENHQNFKSHHLL